MRIVFLGTPEFAVATLDALIKAGKNVVGVITATDKYGGRGKKKLIISAVKKYALDHNLPVLQPKNLKNAEFQENLRAWKADIQVVVAFRMLPVAVWDMPPHGTINLHGSLLPKYRGAAPINWAVINGETETGVTTFKLKHKIDTGDIIAQERMPISINDTAGDVHDGMMILGAKTMVETIRNIENNAVNYLVQDESAVSKAPKIFPEMCKIDFNKSNKEVHNFIRGLSPYPGSWTILKGLKLKVLKTTLDKTTHDLNPGKFVSDNSKFIKVACAEGFVEIHRLQLEGKKQMDTKSFLNGYEF